MNETASTLGIAVIAVFFLGMGIYALLAPAQLAAPFHLRVATPEARSEVRAVYGGFGIAMAVVLGFAAIDLGHLRAGIVVTVAAALAGMALGRIVSGLVGCRTRFYPVWFYCCVEAAGATILAASL